MYRNNIVNFQESTTILNAFTKKSGNLLKAPCKNKTGFLALFPPFFFRMPNQQILEYTNCIPWRKKEVSWV